MLYQRQTYIDKLLSVRDNGLVKVITGMRRCGKSCLLQLFSEQLEQLGIASSHIVSINFESYEYEAVRTHRDLYELASSRLPTEGRSYVLLDEVQYVDGWERAVNALRVDADVDIYLTGSNAHLLSSQIATLLSGRSIEISVMPLTFSEFLGFSGCAADEAALERYARYGGLPPVVEQGVDHGLAQTVLSGVYDTVFVRDIAQHVQVRNQQVFDDIARYLADTVGSPVKVSNIENRLRSAHRAVSNDTVERYIRALLDAFLFRRADRIDVKGGRRLQGLSKYYAADTGIRNMLCGFLPGDYGAVLENIVYNELIARGYVVHVGKTDRLEVDFVATLTDESLRQRTTYIQVTTSMLDAATRERELRALASLGRVPGDRLVITLDRLGLGWEETAGAQVVNAVDWLMGA